MPRKPENDPGAVGCATLVMLGGFLAFWAMCGDSCRSCVRTTERVLENTADELDETARDLERELERQEREREQRRREQERRLKELQPDRR